MPQKQRMNATNMTYAMYGKGFVPEPQSKYQCHSRHASEVANQPQMMRKANEIQKNFDSNDREIDRCLEKQERLNKSVSKLGTKLYVVSNSGATTPSLSFFSAARQFGNKTTNIIEKNKRQLDSYRIRKDKIDKSLEFDKLYN